jgi:WD40 repeat protein
VRGVAIAPDGTWLATASQDLTARTWAADGTPRAVLTGHQGPVLGVAIAPDGSWLATAGSDGIRIWDVASRQEQTTLKDTYGTKSVAVSPDGSWLATGGRNGVRIWDVPTWQERATFKGKWATFKGKWATLTGTDWVEAVAVAPDGSWLATGGDGTVRVWDVATWRKRVTLKDHYHAASRVTAVAPDGSWLASVSYYGTVRIWDAASGQERAVLSGHTNYVEALAVAPDGRWLASADRDGTVRIWDEATWHAQALMRVDNNVRACAWLGCSALLVGGSAGLYLFDFLTGANSAVG